MPQQELASKDSACHMHMTQHSQINKKNFKVNCLWRQGRDKQVQYNRTTCHKPWTPEQTGLQECLSRPTSHPSKKGLVPSLSSTHTVGTPSGITRTGPRIQPQSRSKSSACWSRVPGEESQPPREAQRLRSTAGTPGRSASTLLRGPLEKAEGRGVEEGLASYLPPPSR